MQRLQAEGKRLAREVDQLKMKVALGGGAQRDDGGDASAGEMRATSPASSS